MIEIVALIVAGIQWPCDVLARNFPPVVLTCACYAEAKYFRIGNI
jgi:hypothetical protein